MHKADLKSIELPDGPGVYIFKEKDEILYIGKATSITSRVRSYFAADLIERRGMHLVDMVTRADHIETQVTYSVLEALILESQLIKKNQPYYNSKEKDDRSYFFVVVSDEALPRIFLERGKILERKEDLPYEIRNVYGPYPSGPSIREALKILRKIFPFRTKKSGKQHVDRFYKQLGLLPDVGDDGARSRYIETIKEIEMFLAGNKKSLLKDMEKRMMASAERQDFEYAKVLRNRIFALKHINDVSLLKYDLSYINKGGNTRMEAYDIAHLDGDEMVGVMTVIEDGDVKKSDYRKFIIRGFDKANDPGALLEVLVRRFSHDEWPLPDLIIADGGKVQYQVFKNFIKQREGQFMDKKIDVVSVVKDDKHKAREILGGKRALAKYEPRLITLANNEAHRFAISFHRDRMRKKQLK